MEVEAEKAVLLHRLARCLHYIFLQRIERAPALDDALRMPLPHRVDVIVADGLGADRALEIQRDEAGLDAGVCEFLQHLVFGFAGPLALPVLGERFDVGPLARDPLLRAGIAVQVNDSHAHLSNLPSRREFSSTLCRRSTPGSRRPRACARAA